MSYKTRDEVFNIFNQLKSRYPTKMTSEVIGKTVEGRNIMLYKIGNPHGGKVLLEACIHGGEIMNAELLHQYAKWLLEEKEPTASAILNYNYTLIIPIVNIDKYQITRKNANGVNLNRNFPAGWENAPSDSASADYRGSTPLSEPETQAIDGVFTREKPFAFADLHTGLEPYVNRCPPMTSQQKSYASYLQNKYAELARQRGVTVWDTGESLLRGMAPNQAMSRGIWGFSVETHPTEYNPPPSADEVPTVYLPRALPLFIVLSEECAVVTKSLSTTLGVVLGFMLISSFITEYCKSVIKEVKTIR